MQSQEINKIKELIKTSSLLSPQEKGEWLALAGIMNDKQLLELRRILASLVISQESLVKSQRARVEIPPLTHILNVPKVGAVFPHEEASKIITPPAPSYLKRGEDAKTGFWNKIKDVLAEKELPAGHPEAIEELALPARAQSQYQVSGIKYQGRGGKLESKPPVVPRPPVIPKPVILPSVQPINRHATQQQRAKAVEDKLFVPGLKDTRVFMEAKLATANTRISADSANKVKGMPPSLSAQFSSSEVERLGTSLKHGDAVGINNLEQVSRLKPKDLSGELSGVLKHLAANAGYHKLLQALEKSPMFTAYINTGLAALSGETDLDDVKGEYLNREKFERFVDVLRAIKN